MQTKEQFGASIKAIREQKNYTVRQVALWSEMSPSYLSQVENAKRDIPSPKTLRKIAKGLRVSEYKIFNLAGITTEKALPIDSEIDLAKLLAHNTNGMIFNGATLSASDVQKALDVLTGLFWDKVNYHENTKQKNDD
ncbi:helix-turn-helix domain-containing protein [Periweissella cryptocerci]|uniref:Helix-turn-helix domain-containing protein n=1 Tax=Periweissella cryptocerci TaxID=2506420 RepID=A0A4P6YSW2_9LACO|nr:helix-turn-helix domain-containing protein [Periweissella cryptocerci]QBO35761.1 helix-turn-helix domain-containing protein [Periweissella cryptocerci]